MVALVQISEQQAGKAETANENFEATACAGMFGVKRYATVGLVLAGYGGRWPVASVLTDVADWTVTLSASTTNYVERTIAGVVSKNTVGFTANSVPLFTVVTSTLGITSLTDHRVVTMFGQVDLPVAGGPKRWLTYPALPSLTSGTDKTPVNGTRWWCSLFIPHTVLLTGIGYLIGTVGGTDKAIAELKNAAGASIANSALAGVTVGTLATFQELPFTSTITVLGPAWYYLVLQFNGTTARFRTIPTALGISQTAIASSAAGTFGTLAAITPGTSFTADAGPIAYTY